MHFSNSRVAQRKRAGPITQRSMDRNHPLLLSCCNRIVVSTSRCGRDNPGSNPGYSTFYFEICFINKLVFYSCKLVLHFSFENSYCFTKTEFNHTKQQIFTLFDVHLSFCYRYKKVTNFFV